MFDGKHVGKEKERTSEYPQSRTRGSAARVKMDKTARYTHDNINKKSGYKKRRIQENQDIRNQNV